MYLFLLRCGDCQLRNKEVNILEFSLASLLVGMDNSHSSRSSRCRCVLEYESLNSNVIGIVDTL